ncbi:MAG: hypothetical protein LBU19_08355 [Treponema sp.]|jgi:hypothetical protein|nr:hypothetical protein [Treponema sp.]
MILSPEEKMEMENQLNIFYEAVRSIASPYFKKYGYSCRIIRGRTTVSFEKKINNKYMQIFYTSELKIRFKCFHINYFSQTVVPDNEHPNDNWDYNNDSELINTIKKSIEIIEGNRIIPIWEEQFTAMINRNNNEVKK